MPGCAGRESRDQASGAVGLCTLPPLREKDFNTPLQTLPLRVRGVDLAAAPLCVKGVDFAAAPLHVKTKKR